MGLEFTFLTASQIVFGEGTSLKLEEHLRSVLKASIWEGPCLVVTGRTVQRIAFLLEQLTDCGIEFDIVHTHGEPTIEDAEEATLRGRAISAKYILACGGGSAIDLGKAAAALIPNSGSPLDYLEVIGRGQPLVSDALPCIALPTTAGTGAEVTRNAVLTSVERKVKVSLRHNSMLPALALVDPQLTYSVPQQTTAATGLDALTQCIEPFLSCVANPMTDGLSREGIDHGSRSLRRAVDDGSDGEARRGMALCSLFGGLSLANAKLGAVHGLAGVLGGMVDCAHGAACARLLAPSLRCNLRAMRERTPEHPALGRMDELGARLSADPKAQAEGGIQWLEQLVSELKVPRLSEMGLTSDQISVLVAGAARASSMKGNPLVLTDAELHWIVEQAF